MVCPAYHILGLYQENDEIVRRKEGAFWNMYRVGKTGVFLLFSGLRPNGDIKDRVELAYNLKRGGIAPRRQNRGKPKDRWLESP